MKTTNVMEREATPADWSEACERMASELNGGVLAGDCSTIVGKFGRPLDLAQKVKAVFDRIDRANEPMLGYGMARGYRHDDATRRLMLAAWRWISVRDGHIELDGHCENIDELDDPNLALDIQMRVEQLLGEAAFAHDGILRSAEHPKRPFKNAYDAINSTGDAKRDLRIVRIAGTRNTVLLIKKIGDMNAYAIEEIAIAAELDF